jgi:hypothetical protein
MYTSIGQKYKKTAGWLGNKFHKLQRQGAKFLKSDGLNTAIKVGAGVVAVAGAVGAVNTAVSEGQRKTENETLARMPTGDIFNQSVIDSSPATSDWFNTPGKMNETDKRTLGIPSSGMPKKIMNTSGYSTQSFPTNKPGESGFSSSSPFGSDEFNDPFRFV